MTIAVALVAIVAIGVAFVLFASMRRTLGRLQRLAHDLDETSPPPVTVDGGIDRLERRMTELSGQAAEREAIIDELRAAVDGLQVGVMLVDNDRNVIMCNRAAEQFTAGRHEEALVEAAAERRIGSASAGTASVEVVQVTGPPRRVIQVTGIPLTEHERGAAVVTIADITDQVRIDEVRRDFVANLSHELKSPIGAVGLLAEALAGEQDDGTRVHLLQRICVEMERLDDIIDDLLELSRLEFDGTARRAPAHVSSLVADALDAVGPRADAADVKLRSDVTEASVEVDRVQVVRALTNLLDNAVKYSDPGSVIELSTEPAADRVDFVVVDHGVGIPSADLERIFERFYRVDSARCRATGGTGLGLSIVRHVAHNHGGEVHVTSREGEGSTFRLSLPTPGAP
jgi:two-component system sensor histidine kinase SenX3